MKKRPQSRVIGDATISNMSLTYSPERPVRKMRGFTLIELIVATAILVILDQSGDPPGTGNH